MPIPHPPAFSPPHRRHGLFLLAPLLSLLSAAPARAQTAPPTGTASEPQLSGDDAILKRLTALEKAQEERELADLRREADSEAASSQAQPQASAADAVFTSGARALQALNPELSLTADLGAKVSLKGTDPDSLFGELGPYFRVLGAHFEANLDPYAFLKAAVEFSPMGVGLGEAYGTWVSPVPGLSLTLGKFRQQFGVVNRWHVPALDQFEFPLALRTVLGDEGLNQIGLSAEWRMPALWASAQTLTVQVTNGMNDHLFTGKLAGIPTALLHLRNYWDLTPSTYLELGLSGMWGTNHDPEAKSVPQMQQAYQADGTPIVLYDANGQPIGPMMVPGEPTTVREDWRDTWLGGVDLTVSWAPPNRERYHQVTWRSEYFVVGKETTAGRIVAMGAYTYLDARLSESFVVGVRGDLCQPFALGASDQWTWAVSPYLTWWQSAWVKLRLQGTHLKPPDGPSDTRLVLQAVLSVGPHKHERY